MRKLLLLFILTGIITGLSSCTFDDFKPWIDKVITVAQGMMRGPKAEIKSIDNYTAPTSRGLTGSLQSVLSKTTKVSYSEIPSISTEAKDAVKQMLDKSLSETKEVKSLYCDNANTCILGNAKDGTVTDALLVTDNNGTLSAVELKGNFSESELVQLGKSGEAAKAIEYIKP